MGCNVNCIFADGQFCTHKDMPLKKFFFGLFKDQPDCIIHPYNHNKQPYCELQVQHEKPNFLPPPPPPPRR